MKKQFLPLALIIVLFSTSCKKKTCWQCKTTVYVSIGNAPTQKSENTNQVCDMTSEEINTYQKNGDKQTTYGSGSNRTIQTTRIICNK